MSKNEVKVNINSLFDFLEDDDDEMNEGEYLDDMLPSSFEGGGDVEMAKAKSKSTPARARRSKQKPEEYPNEPVFRFEVEDNFDGLETKMIVCSNNGNDQGKYMINARKRRMSKPILFEMQGDIYKVPSFSLSVDEAKEVISTLQGMIDYLEEV